MITKDKAYLQIQELTERFAEQIDSYKSGEYNETQTRRDFIDPFFKALGWDVDNSEGNAEAYREVIHEDKIKIGKATKAPDYSFRLPGGKRLFFVEVKKPGVDIKGDIYQKLVDQLLQLNEEKSQTNLPSKLSQIEGRIDYCERRINEIVYELYGITEEERKIIEGN
jgi:hypothetical protein